MNGPHRPPAAGDLAEEGGLIAVGLFTLVIQFSAFALPGLVFVVVPLAVIGLVGALLATPFVLAVLLVRSVRQRSEATRVIRPSSRDTSNFRPV